MSSHPEVDATTNGDDDDIIELDAADADPLGAGDQGLSKGNESPEAMDGEEDEAVAVNGSVIDSAEEVSSQDATGNADESMSVDDEDQDMPVNLGNGSDSTTEKNSGLVIIDTNALLEGKGPVPLKSGSTSLLANSKKLIQGADSSTSKGLSSSATPSINIPDDAFLIEAPSFIVPYVFEQLGKENLKELVNSIKEDLIRVREEKIAAGEELTENDEVPETRKPASDDYFDSPTGRLLMSVGTNLVQEYVQTDLLKIQKRQAEKERIKNFGNVISQKTTQSIVSLKKNLEESKENNEPFHYQIKKCELCNFKTESALVLNAHLETPHMRNYSYRCNFCQFTTRVPQEILFHTEAEHNTKSRLERYIIYFII